MNAIKIESKCAKETFNDLNDLLRKHKKLYYVRFGDGEILSMQGKDDCNYTSSEALTHELIEAFTIDDPQYLIACAINPPKERKTSKGVFNIVGHNQEMEDFLVGQKLVTKKMCYENAICFHYAGVFHTRKALLFFDEHIRPKKKMFIGGTPKDVAEKLYGTIHYYVQVPIKNAYNSIDEWWPGIERDVDDVDLVITSAGAASNVICKRLWVLNKEIHLLDIGSMIDAVEGYMSRKWIRLLGHRINNMLPMEHRDNSLSFKIKFCYKDIYYYFRRLFI
ncbi:hypothetical protein JCM14469_09720 [Desulfatiferula olefinivorans]